MPFDIHALDELNSMEEGAEAALVDYQDTLLELFLASPEGQELAKAHPEPGFWAYQFIYYGFVYIGVSLPHLDQRDAREIVEDLYPRKVSLFSPDDADDTIPELLAFWDYLKREYRLPNADAILRYLRKVQPEFKRIMNDPASFGMAKSFLMQGQAMGFDMTDEGDTQKFMTLYNAAALGAEADLAPDPALGSLLGEARPSGRKTTKSRKKRVRRKRASPPKAKKKKRKRRRR